MAVSPQHLTQIMPCKTQTVECSALSKLSVYQIDQFLNIRTLYVVKNSKESASEMEFYISRRQKTTQVICLCEICEVRFTCEKLKRSGWTLNILHFPRKCHLNIGKRMRRLHRLCVMFDMILFRCYNIGQHDIACTVYFVAAEGPRELLQQYFHESSWHE